IPQDQRHRRLRGGAGAYRHVLPPRGPASAARASRSTVAVLSWLRFTCDDGLRTEGYPTGAAIAVSVQGLPNRTKPGGRRDSRRAAVVTRATRDGRSARI